MSYDLERLDSEEFEDLAADIVEHLFQCRVETFKKGKDKGVDGKFRAFNCGKGIIQAKHWVNTPFRTLLSAIEKTEVHKAKKLNADRYIFITSQKLSSANKKSIITAFDGCIRYSEDIIGYDEIERFIKKTPNVERKHYKLWLSSSKTLSLIMNSNIYGDSDFTLQEIYEESQRYVVTSSHLEAINKLENNKVIIITGEPGIGKTTLAKNICLHYVKQGYELYNTGVSIENAKSIFSQDNDKKQIFYYDDFLGKNYIDAISDKEDSSIIRFIRQVQRKENKIFILTSRSNILTKRKFEVEEYNEKKVYKNEFELNINKTTKKEKARILYSHLYHSDIDRDYIETIISEKFYRKIVQHTNFSPRIIEYLFDFDRVESDNILPEQYRDYIQNNLDNPLKIWDRCFEQQNYILKCLILIIAFQGRTNITESELRECYHTIKKIDDRACKEGSPDNFHDCVRVLTGSMISRSFDSNRVTYSVYNPSIIDFLLSKYKREHLKIAQIIASYDSQSPISNLSSVYKINPSSIKSITNEIIDIISKNSLEKKDRYIDSLISLNLQVNNNRNIKNRDILVEWLKSKDYKTFTPGNIDVYLRNVYYLEKDNNRIIPSIYSIPFILRCIESSQDIDDLESVALLINDYDVSDDDDIISLFSYQLEELLYDQFLDIVVSDLILDDYYPGQELEASNAIDSKLDDIINEFALPKLAITEHIITETIDIDSTLEENAADQYESYRERRTKRTSIQRDDDMEEIDEMFCNYEL